MYFIGVYRVGFKDVYLQRYSGIFLVLRWTQSVMLDILFALPQKYFVVVGYASNDNFVLLQRYFTE